MDLACGAMYLSSCLPFFIEAFHQTPCESFLLTVVCHFLPTLHLCVCCAANYSDRRVHPSAIESSNRSSSGHPQVILRSPSEFWEALGTMGDEVSTRGSKTMEKELGIHRGNRLIEKQLLGRAEKTIASSIERQDTNEAVTIDNEKELQIGHVSNNEQGFTFLFVWLFSNKVQRNWELLEPWPG
ncbi:hypothetical protein SDJN03_11356, partial [Cucurbita argyrosperma subsp. sororia]